MYTTAWHVLLVIGDQEERSAIMERLEQCDIRVTAVSSAAEAMSLLRCGTCPDAILVEPASPQMGRDGLLEALRTRADWHRIRPFLLSRQQSQWAVKRLARAHGLGAHAVFCKPFDAEQFRAALETSPASRPSSPPPTNHRRAAQDAPEAAADEHADPAARSSPSPAPDSRFNTPTLGGELHHYGRVLWRHAGMFVLIVVVSLAATIALSTAVTPTYEATCTIRIASAAGGQFDYGASMLATRLSNTYVKLVASQPIVGELMSRLEIDSAPEVEGELVPETELLTISVRHTDPAIARDAANMLAQIMVERSLTLYAGDVPTAREILAEQIVDAEAAINTATDKYVALLAQLGAADETGRSTLSAADLEALREELSLRQDLYADLLVRYEDARVNELMRENAITIVESAELPEKPATPNLLLNSILGLGGSVVAALVVVVVVESLDRSVKSVYEMHAATGARVIGQIPKVRRRKKRILLHTPDPALAEAYNALLVCMQLTVRGTGHSPPVILITSAEPGAGKTTVAANLALVIARSGQRVILVDADLRRPTVHRLFALPGAPGVSDVLMESLAPETVLQATSEDNLRVLAAGSATRQVPSAAHFDRLALLMDELARLSDCVVIDAPGILAAAYTTVLAASASEVLLVVSEHQTNRDDLADAVHHLRTAGTDLTAIVANRVVSRRPYRHYSGSRLGTTA